MNQPSDRNLLLGVLALQNDLVTRDQLIEALNAWAVAKDRPLGEILCQRGALDQEHCRLLEQLLDAHVQRHGSVEQSLAACEPRSSVRAALERVADADVQATLSALQPPHEPDVTEAPSSATAPGIGSRATTPEVLRYRVLRPHAKGGLGEVFVAEDLELHREVALKEIQRQHADQDASRGRFVLEAEITGGLEHPGIVPVYGLGTYADGRPFYAMRFIKGDNLKHASDRFHQSGAHFDSLEFRQLLGRFIDVCNAVAYAHSRGVLHRDLKPGNIMLGKFGETLVVDWGLAKVVGRADSGGEEPTLVPASGSGVAETMQGAAIGTPAFMSPEQALGKVAELGPATDVYSLGATLYALLTNRPPIAEEDLATVLQQVKSGDIPRPRTVNTAIPKPLEAICLKAMALQPGDRYGTALALASDLEHWLADEPVGCYREPFSVRAGRWIQRHRTVVTSGAVAALLLLVGVSAGLALVAQHNRELDAEKRKTDEANVQLADEKQKVEATNAQLAHTNRDLEAANEQERAARKQAESVLRFFQDNVLAAARPEDQEGGLGVTATIRAAIEAAEPQIAEAFRDQPLVEASIRSTLGMTYEYLGEPALAVRQHQRSRELHERELGPDHRQTLGSMNNLAIALKSAGQLAEALSLQQETLRLAQDKLGPDDPDTLAGMSVLATLYTKLSQWERALPLYEQTLSQMRTQLGAEHPDTLTTMANLALAYGDAGQPDKALPLLEETLALRKKVLGPQHPDTLISMSNLAQTYQEVGATDKALSLLEETLPLQMSRLGREHPNTLATMSGLALAYRSAGQPEKVLPLLEETLRLSLAKRGAKHPETLVDMNNLASAYQAAGKLDKALSMFEETLRGRQEQLGPDHQRTLNSMSNLASAYLEAGRTNDALALLEEALRLRTKSLGPDHPDTLDNMRGLARVYESMGNMDQALPLFEETLRLQKEKLGPDHPDTLTTMNNLGGAFETAGRLDKALPLLEETLQLRRQKLGATHPHTLATMNDLAGVYRAAGRVDQALPLMEETLRATKDRLGPTHLHTLIGMNNLAAVYRDAGRLDQAVPLFEETLRLMQAELSPQHPDTLPVMSALANAYLANDQTDKALVLFEQFASICRAGTQSDDRRFGDRLATFSGELLAQQRFPAAERYLRECLAIREKTQPDDWRTFNTASMLGGAVAGQAKQSQATDAAAANTRFTEAERLLVQGYEGIQQRADKIPPEGKTRPTEALQRLVDLYTAWGKPDEAAKWQQKLEEAKAAEATATEAKAGETPAAEAKTEEAKPVDAQVDEAVPAQAKTEEPTNVEPAPEEKKE